MRNFLARWDYRGAIVPALLLVFWYLATKHGWVSNLVLVSFDKLFVAALDREFQQSLLVGLGSTFLRLIQGSLLGVSAGLAFGICLGLSRHFDRFMGPSFHAIRQVAIFAWIPLLTAWFGNGDASKIIFVAIAAFYPVVMGTYEGIRSVPVNYLEVGRVCCFSQVQMLRKIILPSAYPSIVAALQLAFIFSWFSAIGAEQLIGGLSAGIGSVEMAAQERYRTDDVLLVIITISLVGLIINKLLRRKPRYQLQARKIL